MKYFLLKMSIAYVFSSDCVTSFPLHKPLEKGRHDFSIGMGSQQFVSMIFCKQGLKNSPGCLQGGSCYEASIDLFPGSPC